MTTYIFLISDRWDGRWLHVYDGN